MTPALIAAAIALALIVGWALLRSSKGSTAGAVPGAGAHLLDHSPVGTLVLDAALHVTWANEAFCGLFGLTPDELLGRELREVIEQGLKELVEEPDAVEAGLLEAYGSEAKGSPFEFYVRARDGRGERWIEHTCQVIQEKPFDGGRVAYFVDVTPRKNLSPAHQTREIHLHELDQILLTLARKSESTETEKDEPSVLREVADLAARAWKRDRWELWSLSDDRARWTLNHLEYATAREREESTPEISVPQTGPYLRSLEQVRVLVTPDVESDPDGPILLGHGRIRPDAASRLDIPIRVRGRVVGTLIIAHHTARSWTPDETRFAASIGDRMSFMAETGRAEEGTRDVEVQVPQAFPPAASSNIDGFVHLDEKLRFTFLNPAAVQWRTLAESMKGVKDRSIVAEVRKAARGGGPARLRRQLERDGPWLDLYVNPSATGVSVTLQNRARGKERESERSLLDSETRFRSVVESLREGLVITDLNDRIVYVNPRITDMTGHRPEDLDGREAQDLLFDTANWSDGDSRMAARRERKRTRYDAPLLNRDGRVISVEVISTPLRDADGAVTGVVDAITAVENREGLRTAFLAT
jgi:PAS domain S-box-containing protein